jgi:hypothetical protein
VILRQKSWQGGGVIFAVFAGVFAGVAGKPCAERGVFVVKVWRIAW